MALGNWIGRRLAEVVMFLRDKPFIPCQVDWYRGNEAWAGVDEHRVEIKGKLYPGEQVWTSQAVKEWYEHNQRYFNGGRG